jgi:hypothetical protein
LFLFIKTLRPASRRVFFVPTGDLPPGLYILQVDGTPFKLLKQWPGCDPAAFRLSFLPTKYLFSPPIL